MRNESFPLPSEYLYKTNVVPESQINKTRLFYVDETGFPHDLFPDEVIDIGVGCDCYIVDLSKTITTLQQLDEFIAELDKLQKIYSK